ncbi:MAG: tyrosine-type recombinase/integrase [Candidatus Methanoperedens sp.]|nr:tyrosine-type recombinase/integrase [Candidatus Methanoperedens sp.]
MKLSKYLEMKEAQGIEKESHRTYSYVLGYLNKWKELEQITKDDLVSYFNKKEWKVKADSTKNLHIIIIKAYFKDTGKPEVVDWIKRKQLRETISPEQTLTPDDINTLLEVADNTYDKALIAFLFDAGCRISEAQRIKWKDLQDTTDGIIVSIPTKKTGAGYRKVILPFASQYLKNLKIYSYGKDNDFIFHLGYRSHAGRIQKIREESGIQKPFTCHKLRHAAATELVLQGVQEGIIKKKMGWSPSSPMIARYTHPNDDSVIQATLKLNGKERDARKPTNITQPEKLSITDAAGHLFKLEEENSELKVRMQELEKQQANEIENLKSMIIAMSKAEKQKA